MERFVQDSKLAQLKSVEQIDNLVHVIEDELVICSMNDNYISEVAELWANLAAIQQVQAPDRYSFKEEQKNWRVFVKNKMEKKQNLFLVVHSRNDLEIRGILYLQTITLPSSNFVLKGIIEDIYTKPQYRRQGIAKLMLNVAFNWAKKQKVKEVDLITLLHSKDLIQFYLKFIKESKLDINLDLLTL